MRYAEPRREGVGGREVRPRRRSSRALEAVSHQPEQRAVRRDRGTPRTGCCKGRTTAGPRSSSPVAGPRRCSRSSGTRRRPCCSSASRATRAGPPGGPRPRRSSRFSTDRARASRRWALDPLPEMVDDGYVRFVSLPRERSIQHVVVSRGESLDSEFLIESRWRTRARGARREPK